MQESMKGPTKFALPATLEEARQKLVELRLEIDEIDAQLHYREKAQAAIPDPNHEEWRRKALTAMRHRVSTVRALVTWMHERHEAAGSLEVRELLWQAYEALLGRQPDRGVILQIEAYFDRVKEATKA